MNMKNLHWNMKLIKEKKITIFLLKVKCYK